MANELLYEHGLSITVPVIATDVVQDATTDMTLPNGNTGLVVPSGYTFHPLLLTAALSADITAGSALFTVIADGTELTSGPTVTLSDAVQRAAGVARAGADPIAAGSVVSVSITASADMAPTGSSEADAVLSGVLLPSNT